jgi:hypothetical protein
MSALGDDHDGMTVAGWAGAPPAGAEPGPAAAVTGPVVLARRCVACGRANPTRRPQCACGAPLSGDAEPIPRPALGQIRLPDGETIELDRPVIIGRRPKAARFSGQDIPRLVTVDDPDGRISGSHLRIDLVDWSVLVSDVSTNGTWLRRPGQPDQKLPKSEQLVAQVGDVYDLGDGVTVTVTGLA